MTLTSALPTGQTTKPVHLKPDSKKTNSRKQTKMASYWNTSFDKICLGINIGEVTNWFAVRHQASSLFDVITGGNSMKTTVGKSAWKSLIVGSVLQENCNEEGFNIRKTFPFDNASIYIYRLVWLLITKTNAILLTRLVLVLE